MVTLLDRPPGRLRRAWRSRVAWWTSAVVVGFVVVVAIVASIGGHGNNGSAGTSAPVYTPGASNVMPEPSDTDQSIPATPFPVSWEAVSTVLLPTGGAKYGPTVDRPGKVAGWAHTPRGAVLAALNIYTRMLFAPDGQWQTLLGDMILPGPGRDLLGSYKRDAPGPIVEPPGGFEQIAGFKVDSYDPAQAVVSVASQRSANDPIQVVTATVRWVEADWRMQLQPDGSEGPYAAQIPDLASAGFVPFWAA